jgi:hypothetical protein
LFEFGRELNIFAPWVFQAAQAWFFRHWGCFIWMLDSIVWQPMESITNVYTFTFLRWQIGHHVLFLLFYLVGTQYV